MSDQNDNMNVINNNLNQIQQNPEQKMQMIIEALKVE
jgi:hypothetical protein